MFGENAVLDSVSVASAVSRFDYLTTALAFVDLTKAEAGISKWEIEDKTLVLYGTANNETDRGRIESLAVKALTRE